MPEQRWSTLIRGSQSAALKDETAPASILLIMLIDEFGTECLDWEPETLTMEVQDTWGIELSRKNWDKIYALMSVLTSDSFERNVEGFISVCNGVTGAGNDFTVYDPATIEEICLTIGELALLDPPDSGDFKFSEEVKAYIRTRLDYEGFIVPPKLLAQFAPQEPMREPEVFPVEEEDYKAHYDSQNGRRLEIEAEVRKLLQDIVSRLQTLPLRNADKQKIQELQQNASRALAGSAKAKQSVGV